MLTYIIIYIIKEQDFSVIYSRFYDDVDFPIKNLYKLSSFIIRTINNGIIHYTNIFIVNRTGETFFRYIDTTDAYDFTMEQLSLYLRQNQKYCVNGIILEKELEEDE